MKRSAFIVPGIAAVLAAAIVAFVGPFNSPTTSAASSLQFEATFATASDFYSRFDHGFSGLDPASGGNGVPALPQFHGDHNSACEGPTTDRTVHYTADYSELFWHCAPGNDPAKGHIMTGVDTLGYNIAWFSPEAHLREGHAGVLGHQPDCDVQPQVDTGHVRGRSTRRRCDALPGRAARPMAAATARGIRRIRPRLHVARLPQRRRPEHRDRTAQQHARRTQGHRRRHVPLVPERGQLDR